MHAEYILIILNKSWQDIAMEYYVVQSNDIK